MAPTSATTFCLATPPSRSAAARWGRAGGTTVRSTPVLSQEEVDDPYSDFMNHFCFKLFLLLTNEAVSSVPDDYNQLCPHGSGLLPLPVSSVQALGDQHPYIGTLSFIYENLLLLRLLITEKCCWPKLSWNTSGLSFSLARQKLRCLETMAKTLTTACWLGSVTVVFTDSSGSYHMTHGLASATSVGCNIDNQLQALLTLLSLLTAVQQLNSVFYNDITCVGAWQACQDRSKTGDKMDRDFSNTKMS